MYLRFTPTYQLIFFLIIKICCCTGWYMQSSN